MSEEDLTQRGGENYVRKRIVEAAPFLSDAVMGSNASFSDESMLLISPQEIWASPLVVDGGVIIGDAAHSFHPGVGQGAQLAFVDSVTLAPILENCLKTSDFSRERLAELENVRGPFTRLARSTAHQTIPMELAKGRFNRWLRDRYFRKIGKLSQQEEVQEMFAGMRVPTRLEMLRFLVKLLL